MTGMRRTRHVASANARTNAYDEGQGQRLLACDLYQLGFLHIKELHPRNGDTGLLCLQRRPDCATMKAIQTIKGLERIISGL